jgi:Tol biopolymer transport system component
LSAAGQFALSETGTFVFRPGESRENMSDLVWVDRQGEETRIGLPPHRYFMPRLSPDGSKIAVAAADGEQDIWVWDDVNKKPYKLTSGPARKIYPVWTLDSRSVVFSSNPKGGRDDLFRLAADGTDTLKQLTATPEGEYAQQVLRDDRVLIRRIVSNQERRLYVLPLAGNAKSLPVIPTLTAVQVAGAVSPDGRWIAYQSREGSDQDEVHVRPLANAAARHWTISSGGGSMPVWTPPDPSDWERSRSRELIYLNPRQNRLVVVPLAQVSPGEDFAYGKAAQISFNTAKYTFSPQVVGRGYDVSKDGQRFLMVKPLKAGEKGGPSLTVITHWFEELSAAMKGK